MRNIHVITPFSRYHLLDTLIEAYKPMDIIWHLIAFQDEPLPNIHEPWIIPYVIRMNRKDCTAVMPQYFMRNEWIKQNDIIDEDYYVTVDDDDMYEDGVFDQIKKMNEDIIIISMKRGYKIPDDVSEIRRYPTDILLAQPDYIQRGSVSAQQYFVKGKIFKQHLFDDSTSCGDGDVIIHYKESGEQIRYEPKLYALFNYYEPGRWDEIKIVFGVMVNDIMRLDMVFRQSQINPEINCHTIKLPESATKGLNKLLGIMEDEGNDVAILSHQDMFYRQGWIEQVMQQLGKLPESWIVAGIIGKDSDGEICGRLHDMRIPLQFCSAHALPYPASCFDECCIIVNLKKGFRFDEDLDGFDLYGTLCVLQSEEMKGTAWIIDAFAEHYCMRPFTWYPDKDFERRFKWIHKRFPNADRIDTTVLGVPRDSPPADKTPVALSEQVNIHKKSLEKESLELTGISKRR
jgi:hypothetical protein